ncbi:MAG: hypothetical protein R6U42_08230 [Halomonas sp.]
MSLPSLSRPLSERRSRRHGVARWWLAGLLVGCLLPVTFSPVDVMRSGERSACVVLFVPAVLRAHSRHIAWVRRVYQRWLGSAPPDADVQVTPGKRSGVIIVWLVAAQDVFTRRGPPSNRRQTI